MLYSRRRNCTGSKDLCFHAQLQDLSDIGALLFTLEFTGKRYTYYIFLRQTLQTVWPLWTGSVLPHWIYSIASVGGPSSL
ncbi:uncharacterized protein GVI51_J01903 [Nakaseomyces glabratus]|uniref:Uncharacterized protein n=1 Tax=Candida glabrata (strain ATCC 2001 / BCRC 20586 / JCM 3761 / NBRC 0622 / NRRL Y-65 / CBS 138) TaxID=284593 RepID=Q6FPQ0_CANGA|nr:uncharacterized protein CAGL0J02046g [Nakaseomyces glabratus]KAH7599062.1 hypothetical protein J7294_03076 [Nakaseomyces glabratus]KAH7603640.1 hypothetical protein J7293_03193 [Nakaseomyces glabratus]QHS67447.1 uncharacterized protein GVI51_J01903 [Nakaseomyces glabratus]CAG60743.1 unnamed protein product [Nakaseomyces glabratus]|eukprot:XP_447794.1 uncharacterized protein CAGL0J02046g [[Candida] glabrata]